MATSILSARWASTIGNVGSKVDMAAELDGVKDPVDVTFVVNEYSGSGHDRKVYDTTVQAHPNQVLVRAEWLVDAKEEVSARAGLPEYRFQVRVGKKTRTSSNQLRLGNVLGCRWETTHAPTRAGCTAEFHDRETATVVIDSEGLVGFRADVTIRCRVGLPGGGSQWKPIAAFHEVPVTSPHTRVDWFLGGNTTEDLNLQEGYDRYKNHVFDFTFFLATATARSQRFGQVVRYDDPAWNGPTACHVDTKKS